jgi:hypothetical protein
MPLRAIALNCTIKSGGEPSSTELLLTRLMGAPAEHDVETGPIIRAVDDVVHGVSMASAAQPASSSATSFFGATVR